MTTLLDDLILYLAKILGELVQFLADQISALASWIANVLSTIETFLKGIFLELKALFQGLVAQIVSAFDAIIATFQASFQALIDAIWNLIGPFITQMTNFFTSTIDSLVTFVKGAITTLSNWAAGVFIDLQNFINLILPPILEWLKATSTEVANFIAGLLTQIIKPIDEMVKGITASFEKLLGGADSLIEQINVKLQDVASAFATATEAFSEKLKEIGDTLFEDFAVNFEALVAPFKEIVDPTSVEQVKQAVLFSLGPNSLDVVNRAEAQKWVQTLISPSLLGSSLFNLFVSIGLTLGVYKGIAEANAQVVLQEFATAYHYQLLSPADVSIAVRRGALTENDGKEVIIRQGYSPENAQRLLDNAESVPSMGELIVMLHRGIVTKEEFDKASYKLGFDKTLANSFEELGNIIPPVNDLIVMAVKGAFSPDETSLFRTDEDFPDDIIQWAEKQGLSVDWMRKYWRAHWSLPSPGQGFEMFQRGIITERDLNVLLKALDITPFWRDNLIQLSYNVLGRIDIRRIHQLGGMTRDQLVKAHRDLGYSPDDAERLSDFTEQLNKGKPGDVDEELGRLSRTNVINFYQDGVLTAERAAELLVTIGYTVEAATLFIETADFDAERITRAAAIDFILASALAGVLDFGQAQDQLGELHLSPTEFDRATAKLLREQTKATKLPTVDQGTKMYLGNAITKAQFHDLLRRLGYRKEWADAFVFLADKSENETA